jgi:hypothetical protein
MIRVTKIRSTQISKICWTHGKLCCSDQQIVPPQLAETLLHRGVGTERSIPKTFLLRKIPTLCLLAFLIV